MNIFVSLFDFFKRPNLLESSIVRETAAMLSPEEGEILTLQCKNACIKRRDWRVVDFSYRKAVPAIEPFMDCPQLKLAILTVRGTASGFTLAVTVSLARGILHSLDFDRIPWSHPEAVKITGHLVVPSDSLGG